MPETRALLGACAAERWASRSAALFYPRPGPRGGICAKSKRFPKRPAWGIIRRTMKNTSEKNSAGEWIRRFSTVFYQLLVLNFCTLLLTLPVVTAGAALCAMHACLLKMRRGEWDLTAHTEFFRSFRANFKPATLLWLPFMFVFAAVAACLVVTQIAPGVLPGWVMVPALAAGIAALMLFQFVMPMQARFGDAPFQLLKYALSIAVACFPRTLLMSVICAAPTILFLALPWCWPLIITFGLSLPGFLCAKICDPILRLLESDEDIEDFDDDDFLEDASENEEDASDRENR